MPPKLKSPGQINFDTFCAAQGIKGAVVLQAMWMTLERSVKDAWEEAADAVLAKRSLY